MWTTVLASSAPGRKGGAKPRVSSPTLGLSNLMMSAPRSPKICVQQGPGISDIWQWQICRCCHLVSFVRSCQHPGHIQDTYTGQGSRLLLGGKRASRQNHKTIHASSGQACHRRHRCHGCHSISAFSESCLRHFTTAAV